MLAIVCFHKRFSLGHLMDHIAHESIMLCSFRTIVQMLLRRICYFSYSQAASVNNHLLPVMLLLNQQIQYIFIYRLWFCLKWYNKTLNLCTATKCLHACYVCVCMSWCDAARVAHLQTCNIFNEEHEHKHTFPEILVFVFVVFAAVVMCLSISLIYPAFYLHNVFCCIE